jgi:alkyl hydroperoxide reductase subunit AhpC
MPSTNKKTVHDIARLEEKQIDGKTLKVIYVNVDRTKVVTKIRDDFIKEKLPKKTVVIDKTNDLCALYRVGYLPHAVLIDGNGRIRHVAISQDANSRAISKKIAAIQKPTPGK